jgi:hypothetical protein
MSCLSGAHAAEDALNRLLEATEVQTDRLKNHSQNSTNFPLGVDVALLLKILL